jgi:hypothetical protein
MGEVQGGMRFGICAHPLMGEGFCVKWWWGLGMSHVLGGMRLGYARVTPGYRTIWGGG